MTESSKAPGLLANFGRYTVVSGLSFASIFVLTVLLHEVLIITEELAYGITLVVVFAMNFSLMRFWVYRHTRHEKNALRQLGLTALASLAFRLLEFGGFLLLHTWIGVYYLIAMVIVNGGSFIGKFFFLHSVVFGRSSS